MMTVSMQLMTMKIWTSLGDNYFWLSTTYIHHKLGEMSKYLQKKNNLPDFLARPIKLTVFTVIIQVNSTLIHLRKELIAHSFFSIHSALLYVYALIRFYVPGSFIYFEPA